jgi:hypothetical protein
MATTNKLLGASAPSATTNTTLYTVPSLTQANANLFICNRSSTLASVRVALTPSGQSLGNEDYIVYDTPLEANQTMNLTGICLNAEDFCTVYASTANISFVLTGIETTN